MVDTVPEKTPDRQSIAKAFENVGLAVVALVLFWTATELVSRAYGALLKDTPFFGADQRNVLYQNHPYLMRVPRPNAVFRQFRVNRHGFRGPPFDLPKPDGVYRILTLGGSAAWDPNVSGPDQTWAAQLEDLLNAHANGLSTPPLRYEVVNGGVPGYNSAESFLNFVWRGVHVDPDAVIVYQGYNDYKPNRYPDFKPDYSHFRQQEFSVTKQLSRHSRALFYVGEVLDIFSRYRGETFDTVAQPGIDAFQDNLRRIVILARARGIQSFLSHYGTSATLDNFEKHPDKLRSFDKYLPTLTPVGVLDAHARYNDAVTALGEERDVPVIPVHENVPQDFDHYSDHVHFADEGAARAAEAMFEVIREYLLGARATAEDVPVPGLELRPVGPDPLQQPTPLPGPGREEACISDPEAGPRSEIPA